LNYRDVSSFSLYFSFSAVEMGDVPSDEKSTAPPSPSSGSSSFYLFDQKE
jgi:hypothetical protein